MKGGTHPPDLSFADAFEWYLDGAERTSNGCVFWPILDAYGYGRFTYGRRPYRAHVASYVIHKGEIPEGHSVLHDPLACNFRACVMSDHLRTGTQKDNVEDMRLSGTMCVGEAVNMAKLTEQSVREIRRLYAAGATQAGLAQVFGVGQSNIHHVVRGKTWKHLLEAT